MSTRQHSGSSTTGTGATLKDKLSALGHGQALARAVVALMPAAALVTTAAAGTAPPAWLTLGVLVLSVGWAVYPESAVGHTVMVVVLAWWALNLRDAMTWWAVFASALLYAAHIAATLAAYGPPQIPLDGQSVRLWGKRSLFTFLAAPTIYVCARWVQEIPEPPGVWVGGLAAALFAVAVASVILGNRNPPAMDQ